MLRRFFALFVLLLVADTAARAQETSLLMRVDDGVFDMQQGASVDLTDQMVLLHLSTDAPARRGGIEWFYISLAGEKTNVKIGDRIDLKKIRAISANLSSRDECYLDVVDHVAPKGGRSVATFRLFCL